MIMNKRGKNLLIMAGVCVICFAGYGISTGIQKDGDADNDTVETQDKSNTIWDLTSEDITNISYVYNENEAVKLSCKDHSWSYETDESFALNQDMAETMAKTLAEADIQQTIEEKDVDLLNFGLEVPALTVDFTEKDGTVHSLSFGNDNTAAEGYYVQKEDDNNVYIVSADVIGSFQYELYDLLVLDEIPQIEADYVSGMEVSYGGDIYSYTYSIENVEKTEETDESDETEESEEVVWYVSVNGGEKEKCGTDEFATYADYALSIVSDGAADYNAGSEQNLKDTYGIDGDYLKIDYVDSETDEDLSYTLHFGNSDGNGEIYMTVGDSLMVQKADENTVKQILKNR